MDTTAAYAYVSPRRTTFRRVRRWGGLALTIAVVGFWFFLLRPQILGGPAGYVMVSGTSMVPTYSNGDLIIVHAQSTYSVGDIIAYKVPKGEPGAGLQVIHRIIGGTAAKGFVLQGDNRSAPDIWHPRPSDITGKAWLQVPKGGMVLAFLHSPLLLASLAAGIVFAVFLGGSSKKKEPEEEPADVQPIAVAPIPVEHAVPPQVQKTLCIPVSRPLGRRWGECSWTARDLRG